MDLNLLRPCPDCHGGRCTRCAQTGERPEGLYAGWSGQFEDFCVVITNLSVDPDLVIAWANEIDAVYCGGEFIVDFQVDDYRVGPEVYTERALRASFRKSTLIS